MYCHYITQAHNGISLVLLPTFAISVSMDGQVIFYAYVTSNSSDWLKGIKDIGAYLTLARG